MTPEQKAALLEQIAAMLDDPTVTVRIDRGCRRWPNYETMHMESAPTKGITATIEIYGGARVEEYPGRDDFGPRDAAYLEDLKKWIVGNEA